MSRVRRCIYLPRELHERIDAVGERTNVSVAAANGIEAMLRVCEADPDFTMVRRPTAAAEERRRAAAETEVA